LCRKNRVVGHGEKLYGPPRLSLKENQLAKLLALVEGLEEEAEGNKRKCSRKKICKAKRMPLSLHKTPTNTQKARKEVKGARRKSSRCGFPWEGTGPGESKDMAQYDK